MFYSRYVSLGGFRAGHSTETAVLRVLSDLLQAADSGESGVLALLDLSAAFDTVDYAILLERLETSLGLSGSVLNWFRSYLLDRTQYVRCGSSRSVATRLECGVPEGSVLGPLLFVTYTTDLVGIVERHGICPHLYADDTQVYGSCPAAAVGDLQLRLSACIDDVVRWMRSSL